MNYKVLRSWKVVAVLAAAAALSVVVMLLWNATMPAIFAGVLRIDFWHAVGLLILSRVLFGGIPGGRWRQHRRWRRWDGMTPEEREHFKKSFSERYHRQEPR